MSPLSRTSSILVDSRKSSKISILLDKEASEKFTRLPITWTKSSMPLKLLDSIFRKLEASTPWRRFTSTEYIGSSRRPLLLHLKILCATLAAGSRSSTLRKGWLKLNIESSFRMPWLRKSSKRRSGPRWARTVSNLRTSRKIHHLLRWRAP